MNKPLQQQTQQMTPYRHQILHEINNENLNNKLYESKNNPNTNIALQYLKQNNYIKLEGQGLYRTTLKGVAYLNQNPTLPKHTKPTKPTKPRLVTEQQILNHLKKHPYHTTEKIMTHHNATRRRVNYILNRLMKQNKVKRHGNEKYFMYTPNTDQYPNITMTPSQYYALTTIQQQGPTTSSHIAKTINVNIRFARKIVKTLHQQNLIQIAGIDTNTRATLWTTQ